MYQWIVSPFIGPCCRFEPTCSSYALHALDTYPIVKAVPLIVTRLSRCHPWGSSGYDPVLKKDIS